MKQLKISILLFFIAISAHANGLNDKKQGLSEKREYLAYNIKVGGIHIANFLVKYFDDSIEYKTSMKLVPKGLASLLGDIKFEITSSGAVSEKKSGRQLHKPRRYVRKWKNKSFSSHQTIIYNGDNSFPKAKETIIDLSNNKEVLYGELPWRAKRGKQSQRIKDSMLVNSVDPITAFILARSYLLAENEQYFTIQVFDGRRRFNITTEIQDKREFWLKGEDRVLQPTMTTIKPVFGYENQTSDLLSNISLLVLFSIDGRFIPVQAILQTPSVSGAINLLADCYDDREICDLIEEQSHTPLNTK